MKLRRGRLGWWIVGIRPAHGPYPTKAEALEDLKGLRAFAADNPEFVEMGEEQMQIKREAAVAIFQALEFHSAADWNKKRMLARIGALSERVTAADLDEKIKDAELNKLAHELLAASDSGAAVDVLRDGEEAAAQAESKPEPAPAEEPKASADEKSAAGRGRRRKENAGANGSSTLKKKRKTMSYYCGVVLRKHGTDKGITDEMVSEYDAIRGKTDPVEGKANLSWALHVIDGFQEEEEPAGV